MFQIRRKRNTPGCYRIGARRARIKPQKNYAGGVDVFLDNTAGPIHDAVLHNLANHARIVIVGTVSLADKFGQPDVGPRFLRNMLVARARMLTGQNIGKRLVRIRAEPQTVARRT